MIFDLHAPQTTGAGWGRKTGVSIALIIALFVGSTMTASAFDFNGTTLAESTWNRPTTDDAGLVNGLSLAGANVSFSLFPFSVDTTGNYDMLSVATEPASWDNFTFVYKDSFDSAQPLVNALIGNDDYNLTTGESGFDAISLTADTQYFLVTTGFADSDEGTFANSINGPGTVKPGFIVVPEPGTLSLLLLGTGISGTVLYRLRRRIK